MQKVLVVTTPGDGKEAFNVFWADVLIVESEVLQFDEWVFDSRNLVMDEVADELRQLGYTVRRPEVSICVAGGGLERNTN
jgi:hypothetical protein